MTDNGSENEGGELTCDLSKGEKTLLMFSREGMLALGMWKDNRAGLNRIGQDKLDSEHIILKEVVWIEVSSKIGEIVVCSSANSNDLTERENE